MRFVADLHIHGRYSRACSKELSIQNLEKWARIKGVNLLGTGDFTHPKWIEHIKETLKEDGTGLLKTESGFPFVLQTEVSLVYSYGGKLRRIHNLVFAPSLDVVEHITEALKKKGRVDYDGRPVFNIPCPDFVEMMKEVSKDIEVVPAHAWTPWFSLFGSNSGFDSLKECFQDTAKEIHAIETGLSSTPEMNWRLSQLDSINLVSFSDTHSFWPWRLGREATIFDIEPCYKSFLQAVRTGEGLEATIEVDPAYGKYHVDGHRLCNIRLSPEESIKLNNICPVCKRQLTIGVLHRVEQLADRPVGYVRKNAVVAYNLMPLSEIIATVMQKGIATKEVWAVYNVLIENFGNELEVLMTASFEELLRLVDKEIAELIVNIRKGRVRIEPGYDGVYGSIAGYDSPKERDTKNFEGARDRNEQKRIADF